MTRLKLFITVILTVLFSMSVISGCGGGKKGLSSPAVYGGTATAPGESTKEADKKSQAEPVKKKPVYISSRTEKESNEPDNESSRVSDKTPVSSLGAHRAEETSSTDDSQTYYEQVYSNESAAAVDDDIWRQLDLADEYHSLGVIANREGSWEEAQYYFEKGLKILAQLDIETSGNYPSNNDSENENLSDAENDVTPEAAKYSRLLNNIVADYRLALRSLGTLEEDVSAAVLVERFGDLGSTLSDDIHVYKPEVGKVRYDLPIVMNERVKNSIVYFQTVAKDAFEKYLRRSKKYTPMMKEIIRQYDLPEDLIYLSLVESGYNPQAYSWARAMGLWQFIASTGRLYKLDRNWWIDERKDPVKSTHAACRFLKDLYKQFGDWELAMAAYNGGPGRVSRTIKSQNTTDFWKMRLRRQTMDYVPLIMAATIICKDPERYGFNVTDFEDVIVWDEVTIDRCLDLKTVANTLGCSLTDLKALNPELLRNYTPPNSGDYNLKIPKGSTDLFWAAYDKMPSPKETSWVKHTIRRGETVSTIAARYGVSQYAITEANNMRSFRIIAGKTLIVPVPLDREYASNSRSDKEYTSSNSVYQVRSGDTMWDIARAFGTTVSALRQVNSIGRGSRIYVGQKLRIPSGATRLASKNEVTRGATTPKIASNKSNNGTTASYKVQNGDTLWDIARRFGTTTSYLRQINGLGRSSRIYPGQKLLVSGSGGGYVTHKVRRGETLSLIARKYRTTTTKIMAQNNISDPDQILIGSNLRILTR